MVAISASNRIQLPTYTHTVSLTKNRREGILWLADPKELPGEISIRLLSDGKATPAGYGKNHPRRAAVFLP